MDNHIDNAKLTLKRNGKSFYWAGKFLAEENINILAISTSEIKISVLIEENYTNIAVKSLHDANNL